MLSIRLIKGIEFCVLNIFKYNNSLFIIVDNRLVIIIVFSDVYILVEINFFGYFFLCYREKDSFFFIIICFVIIFEGYVCFYGVWSFYE